MIPAVQSRLRNFDILPTTHREMPDRIRKLLKNFDRCRFTTDPHNACKAGSREPCLSHDDAKHDFQAERTRLLRVTFSYAMVIAAVAFAISVYRSVHYGWYPMLTWHLVEYFLAAVLFVCWRRLPPFIIFCVLLGLIGGDVIVSLLFAGLASSGMLSLIAVCAFAGVFIGRRAGLAFFGVGALFACLIGAGFWTGTITVWPGMQDYLSTPVAWLLQLALVTLYTIPLVLAAGGLHERMNRTLGELIETNERLQDEMAMRRLAEAELRVSEEKYRHIFEHAAEGIFVLSADIKLLSANPALAHMAGCATPEEMIIGFNETGPTFVNPEERIALGEMLRGQGHAEAVECRMYAKNGQIQWVSLNIRSVRDDQGCVVRYEGTVEDITKRKHAEAALRESAVKYRTVVENSLVALCVVEEGYFRFVNNKFCDTLGYAAEEIVDRMTPDDMVHPDHKEVLQENIERMAVNGRGDFEIELKAVRKDKGVITLKVLASSTDCGGRITYLGTFIDITKERMLESKLRQAQKMEAIGTLAGGVAHDFNNMLTVLTGYGTLLKMKLQPADPLTHYVDQMLLASNKATSLTQSLLTFGRLQPISLKPVNINAVVRDTEKLLRRLITEDIALTTFFSREEIIALADSTQIDQILFNLATNARDAMPHGGILTITTSLVAIDNDFILNHGFGEVGRYALLSVTDTGIGMDEKTKERIFDPFYTTKEEGKGTGLGLSTVYGIVKQHGGYITVWSKPGKGANFRIYLPAVKAAADALLHPELDIVRGTATVLVADDNAEVRNLVRDMLCYCGYTVIDAVDGEDALNRFKGNTDIVLAILDFVMPGKNGRQVYEAMKAERPEIKVLFMSGHPRQVILDKGIEENDVDFIEKPLPPYEFLKKVEGMLATG